MLQQGRFYLGQFYAMASDLDLAIHTSEKLKRLIGQSASQVACAIEPCSRLLAPGMGQKALCGQIRSSPVSTCDVGTTNIDLARHPDRDKLPCLIQQIHLRIGNRATNGNREQSLRGGELAPFPCVIASGIGSYL